MSSTSSKNKNIQYVDSRMRFDFDDDKDHLPIPSTSSNNKNIQYADSRMRFDFDDESSVHSPSPISNHHASFWKKGPKEKIDVLKHHEIHKPRRK